MFDILSRGMPLRHVCVSCADCVSYALAPSSSRVLCCTHSAKVQLRELSHDEGDDSDAFARVARFDPLLALDHLKSLPIYEGQALYTETFPGRDGEYAETAHPLHPEVTAALAASKGVTRWVTTRTMISSCFPLFFFVVALLRLYWVPERLPAADPHLALVLPVYPDIVVGVALSTQMPTLYELDARKDSPCYLSRMGHMARKPHPLPAAPLAQLLCTQALLLCCSARIRQAGCATS